MIENIYYNITMSNTPDQEPQFPDLSNIPIDIPSINPSEIIIPAKESLHNASLTQEEVKTEYRRLLEEQEEKKARYLAHIKREKELLLKDPTAIKFKIRNLKDHHDACLEALHYANQDYEAWVNKADLTGKLASARAIKEGIEKEIEDCRTEISKLEALL
jgi:chromosome segregation ATPase